MMGNMSNSKKQPLIVTAITLLSASAIAFSYSRTPYFDVILFLKIFLAIVFGPISGLVFAINDGKLMDAMWLLIISFVLSVYPLMIYFCSLKYRKWFLIYTGAIFWLCSGFIFTIGIWI